MPTPWQPSNISKLYSSICQVRVFYLIMKISGGSWQISQGGNCSDDDSDDPFDGKIYRKQEHCHICFLVKLHSVFTFKYLWTWTDTLVLQKCIQIAQHCTNNTLYSQKQTVNTANIQISNNILKILCSLIILSWKWKCTHSIVNYKYKYNLWPVI